jgi:hypothetical protein
MTPNDLDQLWELLRVARTYQVRVLSLDGQLRHTGAGQVVVESGPGRITWREAGRWESGALAGIRFHNSTSWARDGEAFTVQHLRRGDQQPVLLARLEWSGGGWRSVAPHLCGEDRYHAEIRMVDDGLVIEWRVESPSDPYVMEVAVSSE